MVKGSIPDFDNPACDIRTEPIDGINCKFCMTAYSLGKELSAADRYNEPEKGMCPDKEHRCPYRKGVPVPTHHEKESMSPFFTYRNL